MQDREGFSYDRLFDVPSFAKRELLKGIYEEYRHVGLADLRAARAELREWRDELEQQAQQLAEEGDEDAATQKRVDAGIYHIRAEGLSLLLRTRIESGKLTGDLPSLDASENGSVPAGGIDQLFSDVELTDQMREKLSEAITLVRTQAEARSEFWKRNQGDEKASEIIDDLAERYNRSPSTIDNWVYPAPSG